MITIHDVRGAPIPGVSGAVRSTPVRPTNFRQLLEQLAPPKRTLPVGRPAAPSSSPVPGPQSSILTAPDGLPAAGTGPRERLADTIRTSAGQAGVDPALSVAVARAESNLDPSARSSDGLSVGTFQVTHYTKAEMQRKIATGTVDRPPGPDDVALGVGYLRYLHDVFGRDTRLAPGVSTVRVADAAERRRFAVAAFNAGEGRVAQAQARVARAGGNPADYAAVRPHLPRITRAYVDRVIRWADAGGETASS